MTIIEVVIGFLFIALLNWSMSTVDRLPTKKVLSQHDKYRKVHLISQKLSNLASYIPTREFPYAVECLENIVNAWADGKRVTVQVVDASSDVAEDDNLSLTMMSHFLN